MCIYTVLLWHYTLAGKVNSEEVDYGHSSELKVIPVDHKPPTTHAEKDFDSQDAKLKATPMKPLSLPDPLKSDSDNHDVRSNSPLSEWYTRNVMSNVGTCMYICL